MNIQSTLKKGFLWTTLSLIIFKGSSLISQWSLGWLLTPEDFSNFAAVFSVISVLIPFADAGVTKLLMKEGFANKELINITISLSYICSFTITTGIILFALSFVGDPGTLWLYILASCTIPLITRAGIGKSFLSTQLQFRKVSKINSFSAVNKMLGTIVSAIFGAGSFSMIIGLLVSKTYEAFSIRIPNMEFRLNRNIFRNNGKELRNLGWISFSSIAIAFSLNSDYLMLSYLGKSDILGYYFFAFQIQSAISIFVTSASNTVLMPALSKMTIVERHHNFSQLLSIGFFFLVPLFLFLSTCIGPIIHLLWNGKWDPAIIIAQSLFASLGLRTIGALCRSFIESMGAWKLQSLLSWLDAILTAFSAGIGSVIGGLEGLAWSVGIYRALFGLGMLAWTILYTRFSITKSSSVLLIGSGTNIISILISLFFPLSIPNFITFPLIWLFLVLLFPSSRKMLLQIFSQIKNKKSLS